MAAFAAPLVISGISALGGLLGNRDKNVQSSSTTDHNNTVTGSSTPTLDPYNQQLRDTLIDYYRRSLDDDTDLSGYKANGLATITSAGKARTNMIKNSLASRGLSFSPQAALAPAMSESARIGDSAQFINTVPMLAQQLKQQRLNDAANFQRGLPVGTSTVGTDTGRTQMAGTNVQPGNPAGGAVGNLGLTLAGLLGNGAFQKPKVTQPMPGDWQQGT